MEHDELMKKLEKIWTDKKPDHLDPEVKRYWRWVWSISFFVIILVFVFPLALPLLFFISTGWFMTGIVLLFAAYIFIVFPILYIYSIPSC